MSRLTSPPYSSLVRSQAQQDTLDEISGTESSAVKRTPAKSSGLERACNQHSTVSDAPSSINDR